jgi:hypothetical protein
MSFRWCMWSDRRGRYGECRMKDEGWRMEDEGWRGGWRIEDGGWRVRDVGRIRWAGDDRDVTRGLRFSFWLLHFLRT